MFHLMSVSNRRPGVRIVGASRMSTVGTRLLRLRSAEARSFLCWTCAAPLIVGQTISIPPLSLGRSGAVAPSSGSMTTVGPTSWMSLQRCNKASSLLSDRLLHLRTFFPMAWPSSAVKRIHPLAAKRRFLSPTHACMTPDSECCLPGSNRWPIS